MENMGKEAFGLLKNRILEILPNSPLDFEPIHAELVLKWVLKLKPDADEALQIAAIAHDIDRAVTGITEKDCKDYTKIDEFKQKHANRSADIIANILSEYDYSDEIIQKVRSLVEKHEVGGDAESDILKDADSIAYFDYNIPSYWKRNGTERVKGKIRMMYNRMSDTAKKMVDDMEFEDAEIKSIVSEALSE